MYISFAIMGVFLKRFGTYAAPNNFYGVDISEFSDLFYLRCPYQKSKIKFIGHPIN